LVDAWVWQRDAWRFLPSLAPVRPGGSGLVFDLGAGAMTLWHPPGGDASSWSSYRLTGSDWVPVTAGGRNKGDASAFQSHRCGDTTFAVRQVIEGYEAATFVGGKWSRGRLIELSVQEPGKERVALPMSLACDALGKPLLFLKDDAAASHLAFRASGDDWVRVPSLDLEKSTAVVTRDEARNTLVAVTSGGTFLAFGDERFADPLLASPYANGASTATFDPRNEQALFPGGVCNQSPANACLIKSASPVLGGLAVSPVTLWRAKGVWRSSAPQPTIVGAGNAVAFDETSGSALLFGGDVQGGLSNEVSRWTGTEWRVDRVVSSRPPARAAANWTYDPVRRKMVMFGGFNQRVGLGQGLADGVWEYDSTALAWVQRSGTLPFSVTEVNSSAFDRIAGAVVVMVRRSTGRYQTWLWNGSAWTSPDDTVALRTGYSLVWHPQLQSLVAFGGAAGESFFVRDNGAWRSLIQAQAPPSFLWSTAYFDESDDTLFVHGSVGGASRSAWQLIVRGQACSSSEGCGAGACVDGVCCVEQRCGTCETCNGDDPGRCTQVRNAEDADSCAGANACSLEGTCKPNVGAKCTEGATCASGHCVDGVCCNTECDGLCEACSVETKVTGEGAGVCGPAKSTAEETCRGCATDAQCGPYRCVNQLCKSECTSIVDCSGDNECLAGRCIKPGELQGSASCGSSSGASTASWGLLGLALASLVRRRARPRR
jgi:hypothetical protein